MAKALYQQLRPSTVLSTESSTQGVARKDFEQLYVRAGKPLLLRQVNCTWPAVGKWTLSYLRERAGNCAVTVERYADSPYFRPSSVERVTLAEYLSRVAKSNSPNSLFMSEVPIDTELSPLRHDIKTPEFLPRRATVERKIFFGRDTVTPAHYHANNEALLCQVVGEKRVFLYSPKSFYKLMPEPWYSKYFNHSRIDFADVDQFRTAAMQIPAAVVTLSPGDALYIPVHWWHAVYGFDVSMSVVHFWRASLRCQRFPVPGLRSWLAIAATLLRNRNP